MLALWLTALLFSFMHPASKWIMQAGVGLLPFCILYMSFRVLLQLPIVVYFKAYLPNTPDHPENSVGKEKYKTLAILIGLGMIGGVLRLTEFRGISDGLPVPLVTFLVFSHPVWTLLFSKYINGDPIKPSSYLKLAFAISGIFLITGLHSSELAYPLSSFVGPLVAGVFMALWICVSNLARKRGCSGPTVGFYYDVFSMLALFGIAFVTDHGQSFQQAAQYLSSSERLIEISLFALLTAVIPNYLFYQTASKTSAFVAGLVLSFEPVISSIISWYIWHDTLSSSFLAGASLLMLIHLPFGEIYQQLQKLGKSGTQKPEPKPLDAILIDDDMLVRLTWTSTAEKAQRRFIAFDHPEKFLSQATTFQTKTPIYIDSNLGKDLKGEIIAKKIYSMGFKEIYLATGLSPKDFPPMPWIKAVVDKEPPSQITGQQIH